ncbi:hypothetical protein AGABI2DRAFT_117580 [Agaricus bisporus var. bisporus H97]|uniref:hypothetical protein n=1 Tax=Agaricus bisporus var. bisporus (strain H97 / ATCC MYA-4626 / FGSC 10389) TaxID=936046 RepID=UPI00029F5447|nr:hypothetical protein AGABI2DRAFT_117580 [Agaricus bisporus var. bisporus H97]EKV46994.1 hypothetical protein AGABI2DRAFT_117580 [Agaricus bisporus var. bisporus H97]
MDIVFSIAAGLGLRVYLVRATSPASVIAPAIIGLFEGVLTHQLSFRPTSSVSSPPLDHYLALGLRLAADLLLSKSLPRLVMIGLWAAIGTIISESAFPSSLSSLNSRVSSSSSRRDKEKRHRHSKASPPRISSRVRVYRSPVISTATSDPLPPPQTSTPTRPTVQVNTRSTPPSGQTASSPNYLAASPRSFFSDAETQPSPFPDSSASPKPITVVTQFPSRPRSALSFYEGENDAASAPEPSGGPGRSPHLLTPPDSTIRERTMDSRVDRLSTIDEITSRSEHVSTEDIDPRELRSEENYIPISQVNGGGPLPVPNPTSHYVTDSGTPVASLPPILPAPNSPSVPSDEDELRTPGQPVYEVGSESDELRTPPAVQARVLDNGTTASTPQNATRSVVPDNPLSPLMLNSQSDPIAVPGTTLSSYAMLQPPPEPTPPFPIVAPVPARLKVRPQSPTFSDGESVLSTTNPRELVEHGTDIRKQAKFEESELERLMSELRLADKEKRPRDALFLKEDIRLTRERIAELHRRAARRHFDGRNNLQKPDTIDVHGLKPDEALFRTEERLRHLLRNGHSTLNVIVGKGLHSPNGVPAVKNHIVREMQRQKIPCRVDQFNAGILILTLAPLDS